MSDYINREEALNQFYTLYYFPKGSGDQYMGQIESIHDRIRDLPSADVEERKHGKWKEITRYGIDSQRAICECSVCGGNAWVYDDEKRKFKYCPNCGADMRGDSNE